MIGGVDVVMWAIPFGLFLLLVLTAVTGWPFSGSIGRIQPWRRF